MVITTVRMKNVLEKYGFMVSRKSFCLSQVTYQAGAYPSSCSIKRLALLLIPPGWDANPSQGSPPPCSNFASTIYTPGCGEELVNRAGQIKALWHSLQLSS